MDIYSIGAVIAELFLEEMLFDHTKLCASKKGKFNQDLENTFKKIGDKKLESILLNMMKLNPQERIGLNECFKYFSEEVCPISFPTMLIHFNTLFVSTDYWKPDKKIGLIYKHWKQINKLIFGINKPINELKQKLNLQLINKLILDNPFGKYYMEIYPLIFDLSCKNNNKLLQEENISASKFLENNNSHSILIIINHILSSILNTKFASTKIVAIEMLSHLCKNISDIMKIQLVIPYLIKLLKDSSTLVRYTALNEILIILTLIEDLTDIPSSDYNFFDAYIFPSILDLYFSNEPSLVLAFANNIEKLAELEQKFLQITLRSRFSNMKTNNGTILGDNNLSQVPKNYGFLFNNSLGQNANKGEEIILAYDTDLSEFKSTLFKIIEDILSKNEETDVQQIFIRKLPNLMLFYGRRETDNFSKFIIAHFNKKDWIIQREILKCIPSLIMILGETALNQFIVPCMELIISNNLYELKIYEMIHSMHLLLKMEFLETSRGIDLFKKIIVYIMHPNINIRNEVINFACTLLNLLSAGEAYTYLRNELKQYMQIPFLIITPELLKKGLKERFSRVIYEIETKGFNYSFQKNVEDIDAFLILQSVINIGKSNLSAYSNMMSAGQGSDVFSILEAQLVRLKASLEGISLSTVVKKEFIKYLKRFGKEDFRNIEKLFISRLLAISSSPHEYFIPSVGEMVNFSNSKDNLISHENFRLEFLIKSLGIILKDDYLEDDYSKTNLYQNNNNLNINNNFDRKQITIPYSTTNYNSNTNIRDSNSSFKNYNNINTIANWNPQGKLINTLYINKNASVEKLLPVGPELSDKFVSFSSDGEMIMWSIDKTENDIMVNKLASIYTSGKEIIYKNGITNIDSLNYAVAHDNTIELFRVQY